MNVGSYLLGAGILLIVAGLLYKSGLLGWFGHLPGDIRYEGEHTKVYIPVMSMIIISIFLSLLISFFRRWT